jgi:small subunit ribosomal protein S29
MYGPSCPRRSPVLLAIDEAQALFMRSDYRSPQFDYLESYALSLPRLLLDYVSGRKSFNKGAILTAISLSTARHAPPKDIYAAVPNLTKAPVITPYDNVNEHYVEAAKGLEVFNVGDRLDLQEARGILDLCQQRKFVFGGQSWSLISGHKSQY